MWNSRFALVAVALVGVAFGAAGVGPARAELDALMSCAKSGPCLQWSNSLTGDAIKGVSSKGNAVHGQTKFNSSGKTAGKAGVLGEDLSASGILDAGVSGISTNGAGVLGTSMNYNAVEGLSANSTGVYGQTASAGGFGVAGRNTSATHNDGGAGILADGGPANDGIHAFANGAYNAVYAFSQNGSALVANTGSSNTSPELMLQDTSKSVNDIIKAVGQSSNVLELKNDGNAIFNGSLHVNSHALHDYGFEIEGATTAIGDIVMYIGNSSHVELLHTNDYGDLDVAGLLYSHGSCGLGCLQGNKQVRTVRAYAPAEAEPTIEDNGEATLVNGRANVPLDPRFANVIASNAPYLVTLTPEGDCHGLYVTQRTPQGFTVRELQGGESNVGFSYRIVAKRYGVSAPRLPMMAVPVSGQQGRHAPRRQ